jgi:hypothetical protein
MKARGRDKLELGKVTWFRNVKGGSV